MPHIDLYIALAALITGFAVGLTGMGGGALMTPMLVLLFRVQPLAAVSSDLVASVFMKPVGAAVHLRHGAVRRDIAGWLSLGSVPAAFAGVLVIRVLGHGADLQARLQFLLGAALVLAAVLLIVRTAGGLRGGAAPLELEVEPIRVKRLRTVLIGAIGGLLVGITSVGSGSLIIVLLLALYPSMSARSLVGTDLVQAIPLVTSAALGHLLFGDFQLGLTLSILIGAIPGVYVGARLSARPGVTMVRPAIVVVLVASGLKLLGVASILTIAAVVVVCVALLVAGVGRRRRRPALLVENASPAPQEARAASHPTLTWKG